MATTTLNTLLPGFAAHVGALVINDNSPDDAVFATTTDIAANQSIVSTELTDSGWTEDDRLVDYFVRITSGNNSGVIRRITAYTGSSGTITVSGTALAAEAGSVNFEVYRRAPGMLIRALNQGRVLAYPSLYRPIYDRSLNTAAHQRRYARPSSIPQNGVTRVWAERKLGAKTFGNNLVSSLDCDFEGDLTDWSTSGLTLTAESETNEPDNYMVWEGDQSGKVVYSSGTAYALLTVPSGSNYAGQEINVGIWVYSKTASRVSAAIYEDSSSAATGTAHGGSGWEQISVSAVVSQGVSTLEVGVEVSSGSAFTFWADEIIVVAGQSELPKLLGEPIFYWREEGDEIVLVEPIPGFKGLLLEGCGLLSSVATGTDTMELDTFNLPLLYDWAAVALFETELDETDSADMNAIQRRITHYRNNAQRGIGAMVRPATVRSIG